MSTSRSEKAASIASSVKVVPCAFRPWTYSSALFLFKSVARTIVFFQESTSEEYVITLNRMSSPNERMTLDSSVFARYIR